MKKSFKRVLAAVLAVMMVVSSVPVASIVASAATTDISAAIDAYEAKMNTGTVWTNMTAAYNAYIDANEAYDAYVYGYDTSVDLATPTANLTAATNAMTEWTPYTATGTATMGSSTIPSTAYANLLYGNGSADTDYLAGMEVTSGSVIKYGCYGYVYYPETTLLYDGVTTPVIPLASGYIDAGKRYDCNPGLMVTTTANLAMVNAQWVGYTDGFTWNTASDQTISAVAGTISGSTSMGNTSTKRTYSNSMSYTGTPTSTITQITSTDWTYAIQRNSATGTFTNSTKTITIINYKALTDAIASNKSKIAGFADAGATYLEGGFASVVAAFDAATSLNPNSYFTSSNDYNGCGAAIDSAVSALNSATYTADGKGYQALRNAIELAAPTYFAYASDPSAYTEDSWAAFEQECFEATGVMSSLPSTSYNDNAAAQTAADELVAAYNNLQTNDVKVDASALITSINNALDAIKYEAYFTADSYAAANLVEVVKNAKIAVWGAEANYLVGASLPTDNDEGRALVAEQVELVNAAIAKLIFNSDHGIPAYNDMSINSGIAKAATYNSADYANFSIVNDAVADANQFKNNNSVAGCLNGATEGIVATKVGYYDAIVNKLNNAINNLQPAFSKIANGTIVNAGTSTLTQVVSPNDGKWRLDASYNVGRVFFRTTKDAASFDMGGMALNWVNDRDFDQLLDSINLNDTSNPSYHDSSKGELNAIAGTITGGDPTDYALDQATRDSVPGNLSVSNAGGTFALSNIKVLSGSSADGVIGKDGSGNNVTDKSFDFTSLLAVTNATYPISGGVQGKNGTTSMVANYTVSVAQKSAVTLSASTVPTATTFAPSGIYMGMVYFYKYVPTALQKYSGYGHAKTAWSPSATVIDVSNLFELIEICDKLEGAVYTSDSWHNLTTALTAAKADMNYGNMATDAVVTECQTRYTNLWNAYAALEEAFATITFVNAAGTALSSTKYEIGTAAADVTVPANTATTHTDTHHTVYSWPTIAEVTASTTYTETYKTSTHTYKLTDSKEPTCADEGYKTYTCSVCNYSYTETVAATGNHTYEVTDHLDATCIADGYTTYTCSVCGDSYTDTIVSEGTHSWDLTNTITAATCVAQGEGEYTCSVCGATKTDIIDYAPHTYVNATASLEKYNSTGEFDVDDYYFVMITEATCSSEGEAELWCDNGDCEADPIIQTLPVNANSHSWATRPSTTVNATCQAEGYKEYKCTNCDATRRDVIAKSSHTPAATVKENVVAETGAADGSYDEVVYCSVCNEEISRNTVVVNEIDAAAYEAALATVETTKNESTYEAKYTAESRAAFEAAVANAKIDLATTTTQAAIDNAASALTTALTLLQEAPQGYTVTFDVIVNDEANATSSTDGYIYGETIALDATSYVDGGTIYKWTVEDDITGGTTKIESNALTLDLVVTSDLTVTVYIATTPEDTTTYKKISLYGPTGAVIGVGYVPADEAFTYDASSAEIEINGMTFTAPSRAFYTFDGWVVKSESDSELKLKPTYSFVEGESEANVCYIVGVGDVKVNGVENYKANYDESIALTGASNYAIATLVNGSYEISTYLVTNRLHAPHEQTVYIIAIDAADIVPTSTITGTYTESRAAGKVTVGFNNAYFLPEGAELIECGTIATAREAVANDEAAFVIGGEGVNKLTSEIQTKLNEYTIEFTLPTGIATTLYGRSYLVYRVNGEEFTIYSDAISVAL